MPRAAQLQGLEILVLNALLPRPHPLHLSIPEAIATAQAIGARRTLFTHLTHETPHAELEASLPPGIDAGIRRVGGRPGWGVAQGGE